MNISDNEVLPSNLNFSLYRRDRNDRRGGGVLIAIKNTFSSSIICADENIELTWVCVSDPPRKLIFGICYRPPDSPPNFCNMFRNSLTLVQNKYPDTPIFIFGDFNYPQISWPLLSIPDRSSKEAEQFLDVTLDFNLHQSITCPTRGNNTLDLLLTSCPDDIKSVTALPGLSDHSLLHICIASPLKRRSPTTQLITDYKRGNFDAINNELALFFDSFRDTYLTRSVNANWELYKTTLLNLKNGHIPTIVIKSDSNNEWFTKRLKSLRNRKKRLYRTAHSNNSSLAWERYHSCAKQYIQELTTAKEKFFSEDLLSILQTNPNKFWRILSPKSRFSRIALTNSEGVTIDTNQCATALNDHFSSVFSSASNTVAVTPLDPPPIEMPDIVICPEGIANLIKALKLSSSAGCDQINSKLLKNTLLLSSQILHLIFTQSLDTGHVPDDWKKAQIVPIFKSGNPAIPTNYRPISMTSIPSKLLEHILFSNIMTHLESINFFYPQQHGFRKSYSCESQLSDFTNDLLQYMDANLQIDAVFLDFSKAFDRVPHNRLLAKLSNLGIPSNIISWLKNFLTNRKQFTTVNDHHSSLTDVTSGVPQGACLSPLLFLIYINDLPNNIVNQLRLFADDCVIYTTIRNPGDSIALQHDLNHIAAWCDQSLMPLNTEKCKLVSFTRKKTVSQFSYKINSFPIAAVTSYKYLGVHLSPSLSWTFHIQTICSDAARTLGYLRRNLKLASPDIKKLAYLTFVRPKLEYASSIWHPSQAYLTHKLEAIQNRAARFICSQYSTNTSVTALKQSLNLHSLESRRIISRLCLLHAFYYHPKSRHPLLKPPHRTSSRISHSNAIARLPSRTSSMLNSFFPQAITLWNHLPDTIASCADRKLFREKLLNHVS